MDNETFHYWDGLTGGYERSKTVVPKTDSRRFTEPGGRLRPPWKDLTTFFIYFSLVKS